MTDTRGQSGKRQAEARDTAVAPANAGKGRLPGEERILKPGDNCVIRTISVRSSMKIIYYLMAADGRIFHNEQEKYEEIGRGLDPGFDAVRDEILASCDPELDSSLEPEAYMHSLMDGIRAAVLEGINQETASIAPKVLVWDLLIIAYSDGYYDPRERRLVRYTVKKLEIDIELFMRMEIGFLEMMHLDSELDWIRTQEHPRLQMKAIARELEAQKAAIFEEMKEIIAG